MKKAIFIIIALLLVATVAVALMARSSAPAASMGSIGVSDPGSAAKLVAGLKSKFTTGKAEIGRTLQAKKSATSFRMKTLLQLHPGQPLETVVDVSCPDRERFTTTIGDRAYHAVRIGDKAYVEQQDGTWTTQQTAAAGWSLHWITPRTLTVVAGSLSGLAGIVWLVLFGTGRVRLPKRLR